MSLRTSYTGSLNTKLAEARTQGLTFISTTNLAQITSDMATQASHGNKKFTLNYGVSYQATDLRLLGPLWEAFKTGIEQGLAAEDIMGNEVTVVLNTSDQLNTSIDLRFQF